MFSTSYQTSAGAPFFKEELVKKLIQAKWEEAIIPNTVEGVKDFYILVDENHKTKDIPTFDHPVYCEDAKGLPFWVIDLRPYRNKIVKDNNGQLEYLLPKDGQVGLLVNRALLEMEWFKDGPANQLHAGNVPLIVFTKWISSLLKKRFTLTDRTFEHVQMIVGYYYLSLHVREKDFNERIHASFILKLIKVIRVREEVLQSVLQNVGYMNNFNDLIDQLRKLDDPIMQRMTLDTVYTLLATSWYGAANTKAILNVSLEFPPSFIALVVSGATESFYRRTIINTFTEAQCQRSDVKEYLIRIKSVINSLRN